MKNNKDPDFKVKTINWLLRHSNHEKVILFGDDTQHDLQVYAEIARTHGTRIKGVYIRQTDADLDKTDSKWWKSLKESVEKVVYFNDSTIKSAH